MELGGRWNGYELRQPRSVPIRVEHYFVRAVAVDSGTGTGTGTGAGPRAEPFTVADGLAVSLTFTEPDADTVSLTDACPDAESGSGAVGAGAG